MQVSSLNEVKIYSLSCGKSLPEWLSDRKKRALQKKDVDVRRRIELIQDFEMPTVCTTIKVSKDGQYILATGTYKPRVRCYDTYQLSLKFERCLDSEVVTFETLSDDYSKIVFLHNDRYIEFHSQSGFYYKTRIPKFGRDFSYHYPSCDLYFVGARENNVCDINSVHGLFATGTIEGRVECWDPRTRGRVGVLDCALSSVTAESEINSLPTISALKFNGALTMAVGTSTGQVLLYDLRSDKPLLVKDHQYGLPIKSVHFQDSLDLILSADSRIIKMWNKNSGKIFTSLEPEHDLNDVCLYPNSGMQYRAAGHFECEGLQAEQREEGRGEVFVGTEDGCWVRDVVGRRSPVCQSAGSVGGMGWEAGGASAGGPRVTMLSGWVLSVVRTDADHGRRRHFCPPGRR
ncbi:NOL10 [Cervus elaphus hippelaphus]|uniref:NOL10 n=1 Tax=Cervus elaphus hippelaphus TaxID=46360 RepID=A0A212CW61_CEREH|nr:NOL10 [Cervus elaphus hippelaphus]